MLAIRSLLFYCGLVLSTLLVAPISVCVLPLAFHKRYYLITRWTKFNLWWLKICCNMSYEINGEDNIPDTPCIVMCKHQSAFETLVLQLIFIPQTWILKKELLNIPIYGWGLASMHPIAIDRRSGIKSSRQIVAQGQLRLQQQIWVIIYPEGTRTAVGETRRYLPGGGMLAEKAEVDVVPIAHNAGYLWPRNSWTKKSGTVTFVIGPAIKSSGKTAKQITKEVETWIETTVASLPNPTTGQ